MKKIKKKKDKTIKKIKKGLQGVPSLPPETAQRNDLFERYVTRNRAAIEVKKNTQKTKPLKSHSALQASYLGLGFRDLRSGLGVQVPVCQQYKA